MKDIKFINLNEKQQFTKFIVTFEKNKKHLGNPQDFLNKIGESLSIYTDALNYTLDNNPFSTYEQIIIEDDNFFNIYMDLNEKNTTKEFIETIILNIDEIKYKPHQVLNCEDLKECYIFLMIKYPYLHIILVVIL
jgi:hypothetical protein